MTKRVAIGVLHDSFDGLHVAERFAEITRSRIAHHSVTIVFYGLIPRKWIIDRSRLQVWNYN